MLTASPSCAGRTSQGAGPNGQGWVANSDVLVRRKIWRFCLWQDFCAIGPVQSRVQGISWAGSSDPGMNYILWGPTLPLILLWPQFQGFGHYRSQAPSGDRLPSICRWRGFQVENCLAFLFPLGNHFLGPLPQHHVISVCPQQLSRPSHRPRPHHPPSHSLSTAESSGQPADVSQQKASVIVSLSQVSPLQLPCGHSLAPFPPRAL